MSEELQKKHKLFKGDKVIYKNSINYLSQRVVEDVTRVCMREDEEFDAVILECSDGCYVDFADIITLEQALDFFDLVQFDFSSLFETVDIKIQGDSKKFKIKGMIAEIT